MRKSPAAVHAENPTAFINLLRFTGAISIAVFLHYRSFFLPLLGLENSFTSGLMKWLMYYSAVFVEMYFIISGYLFAVVYVPRIRAGLTFDRFFTGRILRIVPLAAITCVVCFLENLLLFCVNGRLVGTLSIWSLVRDILFGGGILFHASDPVNGVVWYVSVLMFCYVIAFILTKLSRNEFVYVLPIFTGVMIQYSGAEFALWNLRAARGYIAFFLGVILGIILQSWKKLSGRGVLLIRIIMALELFIVFIVFVFFHSSAAVDRQFYTNYYSFLVFPELFILMYDCRRLNRLCGSAFFRWLGNISFDIYLWNVPLLLAIHFCVSTGLYRGSVQTWGFLVFSAAVHTAVGTLSYYFIERQTVPFLRFMGRVFLEKNGTSETSEEGIRSGESAEGADHWMGTL